MKSESKTTPGPVDSSLENFLREEGIYDKVTAEAQKCVREWLEQQNGSNGE